MKFFYCFLLISMASTQTTVLTSTYGTVPYTMFTPVNEEGVTEEPDYAGFISGGVEAIPNQFPWVVRMLVARSSVSIGCCGGSILDKRWIITAGHCCDEFKDQPERYSFRIGAHKDPSCDTIKRCS